MIPKKIHYCWFGRGDKSSKMQKCMESWKNICSEYEIIEWNEDNFDIHLNKYTEMCYEQKKYAFLSDYVRLLIIYEHGGIYLDTDVEVIRSLDELLNNKAYFGFEDNEHVNTGVGFGAEARNEVVKSMINEYDELLEGEHGTIGCPILNTKALLEYGLVLNGKIQNLKHCIVYSSDYFNPYDDATGKLNCNDNTYSIHWYAKSWMDKKTVLRSKISKPLHRLFGKNFFNRK